MLRLAGLFARQLGWKQAEIVWALSLWCRARGHHDKLGRECERTAATALADLAAERQQQNGAADPDFDETISSLIATAGKRWVCWGYQFRKGKWTKPPVQPGANGTDVAYADPTDPATWSSYQSCIEAAVAGKNGIAGIGLVLIADDLIGIDIDACLNDQIEITDPEIADLVGRLASYTEVSPSGYGLRVLVRGKLTGLPGGKAGFKIKVGETAVEIYAGGRYVTLTGDRYGEAPDVVENAQCWADNDRRAALKREPAGRDRHPAGRLLIIPGANMRHLTLLVILLLGSCSMPPGQAYNPLAPVWSCSPDGAGGQTCRDLNPPDLFGPYGNPQGRRP